VVNHEEIFIIDLYINPDLLLTGFRSFIKKLAVDPLAGTNNLVQDELSNVPDAF